MKTQKPHSPCPLPPCPCPHGLAAHVLEQPRREEGFVCSTIYPRCWWGSGGQRGRGTPGAGAQGIPVGGTHRPDLQLPGHFRHLGKLQINPGVLEGELLPPAAVWDELEVPFGGCVSALGWGSSRFWGGSWGGLSQGSVSGAGESLTPTPPEPGST